MSDPIDQTPAKMSALDIEVPSDEELVAMQKRGELPSDEELVRELASDSTVRPMTGHELARLLLSLPDLPVVVDLGDENHGIQDARVWKEAYWLSGGTVRQEKAIILWDCR